MSKKRLAPPRAATARGRRPATSDPRDLSSLSGAQRGRRDEIVRQTLRMLQRDDFDSIQMRDVALRSDVALGTLYRYFSSKDHLFGAALVEWGYAFERRLAADPLQGTTPLERLRSLVSRVIDAFEQRPQVMRLLSALDTSSDARGRALYLEFAAKTHQIVETPIVEFDGERAEAVGRTLLLVLAGALRAWGSGSLTPDEVRQRVNDAIDLIYPLGGPHDASVASGRGRRNRG